MIKDLTIIYITANEMPSHWMEFQIGKLLEAVEDTNIISVSRKPMDLGTNLIDDNPKSYWNMYMQLLRASELATTDYVAVAEDDTLYTKSHFTEFRPPINAVAYDRSRWSLFTWDKPYMYCMRQRISNCSLIASRTELIFALTERKIAYPNGNEYCGEVGRSKVEKRLRVSVRNCKEFYSYGPIVQLNHSYGTDETQRRNWKRHGQMRAYDIPYWGKAEDIVRIFNDN